MLTFTAEGVILLMQSAEGGTKGSEKMLRITLEAARVNAGFTQKEAAEALKISNKTLVKWEKDASSVTFAQAERLCALYGIPYDNIIFLPSNPVSADCK